MSATHLLLIDDDLDDAEIFYAAVREISITVRYNYIDNSKKALSQLIGGEIKPDLLFLDLNMPAMTGLEMLAEIKSHTGISQLPVIIFTTSSDPATRAAAMEAGAAGFITKPGDFYQLIDLLKPLIV